MSVGLGLGALSGQLNKGRALSIEEKRTQIAQDALQNQKTQQQIANITKIRDDALKHFQQLTDAADMKGIARDDPRYIKSIKEYSAPIYQTLMAARTAGLPFDENGFVSQRDAIMQSPTLKEKQANEAAQQGAIAREKEAGKQSVGDHLTTLEQNLQTAGYTPGTTEYQKAAREMLMKPQVQINNAPSGYMSVGENQLAPVPGGPADPRAKPATAQEQTTAIYTDRAYLADHELTNLQGKYSPYAVNAKRSAENMWLIGETIAGPIANAILTPKDQQAEQAQRDFVNAILRKESGAVISQQEFDNAAKQYFPQPGDSKEVIAQKARNRQTAINALRRASGLNYEYPKIEDAAKVTAIPEGIDPEDWKYMTDEEKALWR